MRKFTFCFLRFESSECSGDGIETTIPVPCAENWNIAIAAFRLMFRSMPDPYIKDLRVIEEDSGPQIIEVRNGHYEHQLCRKCLKRAAFSRPKQIAA